MNVRQSFNLTTGRESNLTQEPEYYLDEPIREDASRAVVSLRNLAIGHAISQGRESINLQDIPTVIKVALSTTTAPRARVFSLLIKNGGELSTSYITSHLKLSYPTARRILEELHFLDIVDIASVADYTKSEGKITLRQEYQWFKNDDFKKFIEEANEEHGRGRGPEQEEYQREECHTISKFLSKEFLEKQDETETRRDTDNPTDHTDHNIQNATVENTVQTCDIVTCHTLKKNLTHAQRKNILLRAIDKKDSDSPENRLLTDMTSLNHRHNLTENKIDYIEDMNYTKNSNSSAEERGHLPTVEQEDSIINYNSNGVQSPLNNILVPVGSKYFHHVTVSHDENVEDYHKEFDSKNNTRIEDITPQEVLSFIESAKGLQIAVSTAVTSVWNGHEQVRNYLGDKLTTRENRRIRDLYLKIIRHPNIEVIKHKPHLIVRWFDKGSSSETLDLESNPL